MKKSLTGILAIAMATVLLSSCNNAAKMAEASDKINITCNPEVLEVKAGEINADVVVTFPADYFQPKYTLTLTPVIKYEGGESVGEPFKYQGEKIADNFKSVSKKNGATIREEIKFKYVEGMEKSTLVARAVVSDGKKKYAYPKDIKIADGANTTYMLVKKDGKYDLMPDDYEYTIPETAEAQILYLINSSEVRSSQIKNDDISDFLDIIKQMTTDPRSTVKGTEIIAYASPDGDVKLNNNLSAGREKSAKQAFDKMTKKINTGEVKTRSIGEDWEGFQELVRNSSIEDRELILRVLSMYSDPNVREREIKNMSSIYQSLSTTVLPELRRARFITTVEYQNYSESELMDLLENNITELDEEALLRVATLVKGDARYAAYNQAIKKYNSDRAKYNAACIALDEKDSNKAQSYIAKIKDKTTPEVCNLLGVISLRNNNFPEAEQYFSKAGEVSRENQGVLAILNGDYKTAAEKFKGDKGRNAAIAFILNGDLKAARAALEGKTCNCSAYCRAIVAAREGKTREAKENLAKASEKDFFAKRAVNDVEFAKIR